MGWNAQDAMMREADPMSYDRLVVKVASPSSVLHTHKKTHNLAFVEPPFIPFFPTILFHVCACLQGTVLGE